MRALLLELVLCGALAACAGSTSPLANGSSGGPTGSDLLASRSPFPPPPGAVPLALDVEPSATPLPSGTVLSCPAALMDPVRVVSTSAAISFEVVSTGVRIQLIWPRGFAAWMIGGKAEILAPDGSVVGRTGDILSSLGGVAPVICFVNGQGYGPAS